MYNPFDSLDNLYRTYDPRDQFAQDIYQTKNTFPTNGFGFPSHNIGTNFGGSKMDTFLRKRQSQLDPRDQEYHDINMYVNNPFKGF